MTSAAPDIDKLIESIKRPAPANIAFVEIRFSRLLKQPTIVAGQLSFLGAGRFDRTVERPYRERTEISNDSVRVARENEPERSFALNRAPEMRAMLQTFSALLSGDQSAIKRDFQISAQGDAQQWSLDLVPLDSHIQRRLNRIAIIGNNDTPQCFSIYAHEGGVSIMLLGPLAALEIAPTIAQDTLLQRCRSGH
jgi:hypothetical protein